jgi:cell division protein FtsL
MTLRGAGGLALLIGFACASALGVIYIKHESRLLFVDLQKLQKERDALDTEWSRLQLEQAAWATHGRVETIARKQLQMEPPPPEQVVFVRP